MSSSSRSSGRASSRDLKHDLSYTDLEQLNFSYEPKVGSISFFFIFKPPVHTDNPELQTLTFGMGPHSKCPVDEEMHDTITITNNGSSSRKFIFYVPSEDETLRTRLHPGSGVVKPVGSLFLPDPLLSGLRAILAQGKSVSISVSCTLLMTTKINRNIKLELEGESFPLFPPRTFWTLCLHDRVGQASH